MSTPPQTQIPDDLVPNRAGYTREQLAIRTLAEIVADLVYWSNCMGRSEAPWKTIADVFALTEPEGE